MSNFDVSKRYLSICELDEFISPTVSQGANLKIDGAKLYLGKVFSNISKISKVKWVRIQHLFYMFEWINNDKVCIKLLDRLKKFDQLLSSDENNVQHRIDATIIKFEVQKISAITKVLKESCVNEILIENIEWKQQKLIKKINKIIRQIIVNEPFLANKARVVSQADPVREPFLKVADDSSIQLKQNAMKEECVQEPQSIGSSGQSEGLKHFLKPKAIKRQKRKTLVKFNASIDKAEAAATIPVASPSSNHQATSENTSIDEQSHLKETRLKIKPQSKKEPNGPDSLPVQKEALAAITWPFPVSSNLDSQKVSNPSNLLAQEAVALISSRRGNEEDGVVEDVPVDSNTGGVLGESDEDSDIEELPQMMIEEGPFEPEIADGQHEEQAEYSMIEPLSIGSSRETLMFQDFFNSQLRSEGIGTSLFEKNVLINNPFSANSSIRMVDSIPEATTMNPMTLRIEGVLRAPSRPAPRAFIGWEKR